MYIDLQPWGVLGPRTPQIRQPLVFLPIISLSWLSVLYRKTAQKMQSSIPCLFPTVVIADGAQADKISLMWAVVSPAWAVSVTGEKLVTYRIHRPYLRKEPTDACSSLTAFVEHASLSLKPALRSAT